MQRVTESMTISPPKEETESMKTGQDDAYDESDSIDKSEESTCRDSFEKVTSTTATATATSPTKIEGSTVEDVISSSGRERLKRHRMEVAGRVWIPEMWGHENLLKDWIDCTAFDASLVKSSIMSARAALMEEGIRRPNSTRFRVENSC